MSTRYIEAYYKIKEAIVLLQGFPNFDDIIDDLEILNEKLKDMIW